MVQFGTIHFYKLFFRNHLHKNYNILNSYQIDFHNIFIYSYIDNINENENINENYDNKYDIIFKRNISLKEINSLKDDSIIWCESISDDIKLYDNYILHRWDRYICLIKYSEVLSFMPNIKVSLITPSIHPENIMTVYKSIKMLYFSSWNIVYDGKKIKTIPNQMEDIHKNIHEHVYFHPNSTSGNAQRNYALNIYKKENYDGYIYFLDDDNSFHPNFYLILHLMEQGNIYTFDSNILKGNKIAIGKIDTAMFIIDFQLCKNIRWIIDKYSSDGHYIKECSLKNKSKTIYLDIVGAYYNNLSIL